MFHCNNNIELKEIDGKISVMNPNYFVSLFYNSLLKLRYFPSSFNKSNKTFKNCDILDKEMTNLTYQ